MKQVFNPLKKLIYFILITHPLYGFHVVFSFQTVVSWPNINYPIVSASKAY